MTLNKMIRDSICEVVDDLINEISAHRRDVLSTAHTTEGTRPPATSSNATAFASTKSASVGSVSPPHNNSGSPNPSPASIRSSAWFAQGQHIFNPEFGSDQPASNDFESGQPTFNAFELVTHNSSESDSPASAHSVGSVPPPP
eukprot:712805_1